VKRWPEKPELPPATPRSEKLERALTDQFHKLFYASHKRGQGWAGTFWLGRRALKCPLDLWVYQELLFELRPDWVIETGTAFGGTALFLASILELLGGGRVVTIELNPETDPPEHPRLECLTGSSTSAKIVSEVKKRVRAGEKALVILDSDHSRDHVAAELEAYAPLVGPGGYLIVEDTNLNGHPVEPEHGPGPAEAVAEFLASHPEFEADASREKFLLTFNPGGWLRRRGSPAGGSAARRPRP
jgi:cephalosporin hydroxylase